MFTRFVLPGILFFATLASGADLFSTNASWRLARGTNEASLPDVTAWRGTNFNDANFVNASSPFWYGDVRPGGTQVGDMLNNYLCLFLRKTFVITNAAQIGGLRMRYYIDDGFVAWINGTEVFRENVAGDALTIGTAASNQPTDPAPFTSGLIFPVGGYLRNGTNLLAIQVFNTSLGSSDLGFDCSLETILAETNPPTIVNVLPAPGSLMSLTQITVTFSEPVNGVSADDLLINTQPASAVSGSGATYTFSFEQPLYGAVPITWFAAPGITDAAVPPNPFDPAGPGASWLYTLQDTVAPTIANLFPPPAITLRNFSQVEVTFSEEVTGVNATDLLVNNQPALSVSRVPAGAYIFQFASQPPGSVTLQWAGSHGITDQATPANGFGGGSWSYVVDPDAPLGDLLISEILASNLDGLKDEDLEPEDWLEIYNRGSTTVNLAGWSLTDDPELPGLWVFPSGTLGPGQYMIVFASGKDVKNPTGTNRFHTNFQLSGDGEFLGLYNGDSPRLLVSAFGAGYPEQRNDNSYGRDTLGQLRYFSAPTPGKPNGNSSILGVAAPVHFSANRGFYAQPFDLLLTSPTPGANIGYTTDGSEPSLLNRRVYLGGLRLTNTTMIRATAFRTNLLPSKSVTHSYLYNFTVAQRSLPVMNIVTATNNLTGRTGIIGMSGGSRAGDGLYITNNPATDYHNPTGHGIAWERPVSAEYILPDNSGFQIDCGIRVQGSDWQRPRTTAGSKFSFRLYFRGDYGDGRLEYPMFPLTTAESFDQLVLRAGFNDNSNPFIRDELTRRLSHDMGGVASHGGFMNLFTNGAFAGYYNACERVHSRVMQSYLGGGDQWDVVAPSFATSSEGLGVVDGDRNDFNDMMNTVWTGAAVRPMTNTANYLALSRRVNFANFADYCLLNAYAAMGDWPANNWRAARERGNPEAAWHFVVWDAEWANGFETKTTIYDTFVQTGTGTLDAGLNSTVNSEIARLHQALRPNPEFRLLWADRVQKHFFNGGALTSANVTNRVGEMAATMQGLFTITDSEFLNWHRDRLAPFFIQLNTYGLYGYSNNLYGFFASSNTPALNQFGGRVAPGFNLTMTAPLGGTIYYTTNGHDPRVPFSGAVSNAAIAYAGALPINRSLPIKARTLLNGSNWSALADAKFEVGTLGVPLRITEIMYNPPGGSLYEFVELQNIGGSELDLGGMYLDDAITFTFSLGSKLAAGARLVLANGTDPASFATAYPGVVVFGHFSGNLNNTGERLTLHRPNGEVIVSVDYSDSGGWPAAADGAGASLELADVFGGTDDPANWRASGQRGGTPGAPSGSSPAPAVILNEVMAQNLSAVNHGGNFPDWVELHNPGVGAVNLAGWSLSDDGNARKFVFPSVNLPGGGHLVVWCDASTNVTPGFHTGFTLDAGGSRVFLYDANTNRSDGVSLGWQLGDYSVGRVAGSWVLTSPTPNAVNIAAPVAAQSSLMINEWLANSSPGQSDWVELYNPAALPVPLGGAYLATTGGVQQLTAPSFIAPFGFVQIFTDETVGSAHLDLRLPASGGVIILSDAAASEIDRVSYTNALEGLTRGRLPNGSPNVVNFPGTASPGTPNYTSTYAGPILNEVLARNQSAVTHAGRVADFIELFNPGTAFSLAGMSLSVGSPSAGEWIFPGDASIPAGGYLILWCDADLPASFTAGNYNLGRALDAESGGVFLFNPAGQLVHSVLHGFQVANKSIGLAGGQWRLLSTPTPGSVNSGSASLGNSGVLRLNEWMAQPTAGADWFEIYNPTNLPIDLSGITLTDDPSLAGQTNFRAAPLSFIGPQGFVKWTADGQLGDGRNHVNFSLDAQGDTLRLYITNGANFVAIDSVTFGAQQRGVSQGRLPDGAPGGIVSFAGSATPAEANYQLVPDVVIHEVLTHAEAPLEDTVELRNAGTNAINIGGWYLSNRPENFKKYRVPNGTVIAAGGYRVFYAVQFNDGSTNAFTLDPVHGDELWLSAADGAGNLTGLRTGARFGPAANGVSFGRHSTRVGINYVAMSALSLGTAVTAQDPPALLAAFRTGTGAANPAPLVGPVVIHELMYHPSPGADSATEDEYVELRNVSGSTVQFFDPAHATNTWRLSGGLDFAFPQGTMLGAGQYLLVVNFDPANPPALSAFRARYGVPPAVAILGPYAGRLGNDADEVNLRKPDAPQPAGASDAGFVPYVLVDKVEYTDAIPWPEGEVDGGGLSLQRGQATQYGNDPMNWVASLPTPGSANGSGIVPPPMITASPQDANVFESASVLFSATATGAGPIQYQWRLNGIHLPDATNTTLAIDYVLLENEGLYDVIASNPGGAVISEPARLLVKVAPVVLAGPVSLTVRPGTNITFGVTARGTPPLTYQWRLNGLNLPGETGAILVRNNVQLADDGVYDVLISNPYAMAIASARLAVLVAPVVLQAPLAQTVPAGSRVNLSVAISGNPAPFGYQWRSNSLVFPLIVTDARINFFSIRTATNAAVATYRVIITNEASMGNGVFAQFNITTVADTDLDGLSDALETSLGLNPNDAADAADDLDQDGMTNLEEFIAGTDPADENSYLRVDQITVPGLATLQVAAISNRTYSVQFADALPTGWRKLADVLARSTNHVELLPDPTWTTNRFYRIATPWQP